MENLKVRQREILEKLNDSGIWQKLDTFYVCYSCYELAFKVWDEILQVLDIENRDFESENVVRKNNNGGWNIIFGLENGIYLKYSIKWVTGMFGDTGLRIGNGVITNEIPNGYKNIDLVFENKIN